MLVVAAALATVSSARTKYLVDCSGSGYWKFYTADGALIDASKIEKDSDFDLEIARMSSLNKSYGSKFNMYSFTVAGTNVTTSMMGPWCDGNGTMTIGEGGVTMAANNMIRFGSKNNIAQFKLAASQTWRGPSGSTAWSEFAIGCKEEWKGYYWQSYAQGLDDITWTLDGRIMLSFTATNSLSTVDVVVNPEARLLLVEKWGSQTFGGALGAKTLTLKGGDTGSSVPLFTIGAKNPAMTAMGTTYAPNAFSDVTLAPKVYLADGASVKGGTVDYAVSELFVSGGDSTFSGDVTVTKDVSMDIGGGSSLEFTGNLYFADDAAIDLTGDGSLKFCGGEAELRVTGDGTLEFDPAGDEIVLRGDLSSFTGRIHVASGALLIHPDAAINEAAAFSAADGASYRTLAAGDFGDYTVDNRQYYRDSHGVSHPYLCMSRVSGNTSWPKAGQFWYLSADGTTNWVDWVDGSVVDFQLPWSAGLGNQAAMHTAGIVRRASSGATTPYIDGNDDVNGVLSIGERGIEFQSTSQGIYFWKTGKCLRLSESQTWKAPASDSFTTSHCRIYLGGSWTYIYPAGSLVATKDDITLTLEGNLLASFYWPTNDFSTANIVVKAPALMHSTTAGGRSDAWKSTFGRINAKTLTFDGGVGMYFGSKTVANTGVGSAAVISPTNVARRIILKNGATLTAAAETVWTGTELAAAAGSSGGMSGTFVLQDELIPLCAEPGATLDLTGARFKEASGVSAGFSATGSGTVRVSFANLSALSGAFAVDGPVVEIADEGRWTSPLAGASGLTVASSGLVSVSAEALEGFDGGISVTSGTLVLDSVAAIPAGGKVITSGNGKLVLIDQTGFDADIHMGGTKNFGTDDLVVTDDARENETLTLSSGQTLQIFGSGLKSSSTVSMEGGSAIFFHKPATVYAPVTVAAGTVAVNCAADAAGTFGGQVTVPKSCAMDVYADGGLSFAKGFMVSGTYRQRSGNVVLRDTASSFSGGEPQFYAGTFTVTNCSITSTSASWRMDMAGQTGDVTVEIAKGGTWYIGNNSVPYVGQSNAYESRILINGGTMWHQTYDSFRMDYTGNGKAVVELRGGTLSTERRIISAHDMSSDTGYAKFIWSGGKIQTGGSYPFRYTEFFMGNKPNATSADTARGVEFIVNGTNCVLDLAGFLYPNAISNFAAGASRMIGAPGAVLTVKGRSGYENTLTLANFEPNGMALDLNQTPAADVAIVGDGTEKVLGWVTPGTTGGKVVCTGTASPLLANYLVPAGGTFENAYVNDDWCTGFSYVTASNLVFGAGSTYRVYTAPGGFVPLTLAGSLVLPGGATLAVDKSAAPLPVGEAQVLVSPAEGVKGDCAWTLSGASRHAARVYTGNGSLCFDYVPTAMMLLLR